MSTATDKTITVEFNPNATSKQSDVIAGATQVKAGCMTAADKTKLDSLSPGGGSLQSAYDGGASISVAPGVPVVIGGAEDTSLQEWSAGDVPRLRVSYESGLGAIVLRSLSPLGFGGFLIAGANSEDPDVAPSGVSITGGNAAPGSLLPGGTVTVGSGSGSEASAAGNLVLEPASGASLSGGQLLLRAGQVGAGRSTISIGIEADTSVSLLGFSGKLGFFQRAPVTIRSVAADTLANLYIALRAYGLIDEP